MLWTLKNKRMAHLEFGIRLWFSCAFSILHDGFETKPFFGHNKDEYEMVNIQTNINIDDTDTIQVLNFPKLIFLIRKRTKQVFVV